jgi:phosphoesterase RecJ-like protein
MVEAIRSAEKVVIVSHHSPDGDAVGSMIALREIVRHFHREPHLFLPEPVPPSFRFIDPENSIQTYDPEKDSDVLLNSDLWFCLDFNVPSRMGRMGDLLAKYEGDVICIDHHKSPAPFGQIMFADDTAAATAVLIAEWAEWQSGPWTEALITAIYAAIVSDTGGFRYANTHARTLSMAARLVERGADPFEISRNLYERWQEGRLRLLTRVLSSLEVDRNIRTAFLSARRSDFEATGTGPQDLEEFVNYGRILDQIEIGILLCELKDGKCKASIRSNGSVNVEEIALSLGGGGHQAAAGVKLDLPIEEAREKLREAIRSYMQTNRK